MVCTRRFHRLGYSIPEDAHSQFVHRSDRGCQVQACTTDGRGQRPLRTRGGVDAFAGPFLDGKPQVSPCSREVLQKCTALDYDHDVI